MPLNITFQPDVSDVLDQMLGLLADGSPLDELLAQFGPDAEAQIEEALLDGIEHGESVDQIARSITDAFDMPRWRALSIARTEVMRAYRAATLETYAENSDVLNGWIWLSTLSTRTCPACWSLNGTFFPLSTTFFPAHTSCRCTSIPSIKGSENPLTSGADEFADLPIADQQTILGPSGYEIYASGVPLSDFAMLTKDRTWGNAYVTRPLYLLKSRKKAA